MLEFHSGIQGLEARKTNQQAAKRLNAARVLDLVELRFARARKHRLDYSIHTAPVNMYTHNTKSTRQLQKPKRHVPRAQVWLSGVIPGYNPATATSAKPTSPRTRQARRIAAAGSTLDKGI